MMDTIQHTSERFNILDELLLTKKSDSETKSKEQTSLDRLIVNSKHIEALFTSRHELKGLRIDELELLHDIRELVEAESKSFEAIKDPALYRREIRSRILPKYITLEFIRQTQEKVIAALLNSSLSSKDQDALMTAMVFLQSHTDLGLPCQDNPLWEIIFNLSIKDGIRFVDSLTALIEGLDSIRDKNPKLLDQEPLLLQKTMQISQWPIFWRHLAEHSRDSSSYEPLTSAILRGEMMPEIYFDEIVHLPLLLFQQFKDVLSDSTFFEEQLTDAEKDDISKHVLKNIVHSIERDMPSLVPLLIKRLKEMKGHGNHQGKKEMIDALIKALNTSKKYAANIFILTLMVAKMSIRKYWDNKRDFLFFFTVFKDPEEPRNYYDYGQILIKIKHLETAEKIFRCAIDVDSNSYWGYWGLGSFYLKQQRLTESEQELSTALKIVQKKEIDAPGRLKRELFLIKEDLKTLKKEKIKQQVQSEQQIDMFHM